MEQVTIRDIARKCKVGVSTVSRAMNNHPDINPETKEIYMETAAHFECNWTAVERNIRTAVSRAWSVNPDLLCQMAGYPLESEPTSSQFIEIISSYIIRSHQPQPLALP